MTRPLFGLLLLSIALGPASTTSAADWPQYRGILGDGKSGESLPDRMKLHALWKIPTPLGFSSLSIADGRAFTLIVDEAEGREACIGIDIQTGKVIWQQPLGSSDYGHDGGNAGAPGNRGGDGPRSTPSTDGQHVYVYDSNMVLSCFRAADGEPVWRHDVVADYQGRTIKWKNATSPLLDGDRIYIAGGGAGASFLAFQAATGDLLWKSGDETLTHATPHLAEIHGKQQLIFFMVSGLVAIDPTSGQELWRQPFRFSVSTAASPVSAANRVYCSAGYGVGAGLYQISEAQQVSKVWLMPNKLMNHWSTPLESDGHLYGIFEFKKYGRAPLQCVSLETGEIQWSERGFGPGNCILVDGKLIILSDAGELVIAKATPESYQELARTKVLNGKCWSTPAYSDGRLYLRSTEEAVCLELRALDAS